MFRAIFPNNFPPFRDAVMTFPEVKGKPPELAEVHLLTGVNGTGKTRLLASLAAMMNYSDPLLKRCRGLNEVSKIGFTQGAVPSTDLEAYELSLGVGRAGVTASAHDMESISWASNVAAFAYGGTAYVADAAISLTAEVPVPSRQDCLKFSRPEDQSAALLQAIANLKVQAALDQMDGANSGSNPSHATQLLRELESVISQVTGTKFTFEVTSYPKAVLKVRWGKNLLPFDALPDGLRSIIGWLAHAVVMMDALLQGKGSPLQTEAVFLLDEIETSLHPAWQRKILPAFQSLFPKAQMFVATHSPFLISSLNHGWIHQLTFDADGKVKAEEPKAASEGDSYVTVVEDIMGVKEWFDPETEGMLEEFRGQRTAAYKGDAAAKETALTLAAKIGDRSMELYYMMGREINQMERQLTKAAQPK